MSQFGLKVLLGMFPSASKVEEKRAALRAEYDNFIAYGQSEEWHRFTELNNYVHSDEFARRLQDPDETNQVELAAYRAEFESRSKDGELRRYFKSRAREAMFVPLTEWELVMEDDFTGDKLNPDTWMPRHYWGDKLLGRNFSFAGGRHCTTEGKNISVSDSCASIETRREKATGLVWSQMCGFLAQECDYTSGTFNSSKGFKMHYGKIEAKITVPKGRAYHAFWLGGEKILPQVNIFKFEKGKFVHGAFWQRKDESRKDISSTTGLLAGKSCIFGLEWSKDRLQWTINGVVVKTLTEGIPREALYIAFASGVEGKRALHNDVAMKIDWVRVYKRVSGK